MNLRLYRESQRRPCIPAHTKIRLSYARALFRPCSPRDHAPPTPTTVSRMTKRYMPVTEEVTPPISPASVETDPATPSPVNRPGRGRGRGKWRAQSSEMPGVGTRSRTKQQKQQLCRHRLRAPRGRKNQTSLHKSRVWHVIYDYRTHQRTDSEIHR